MLPQRIMSRYRLVLNEDCAIHSIISPNLAVLGLDSVIFALLCSRFSSHVAHRVYSNWLQVTATSRVLYHRRLQAMSIDRALQLWNGELEG